MMSLQLRYPTVWNIICIYRIMFQIQIWLLWRWCHSSSGTQQSGILYVYIELCSRSRYGCCEDGVTPAQVPNSLEYYMYMYRIMFQIPDMAVVKMMLLQLRDPTSRGVQKSVLSHKNVSKLEYCMWYILTYQDWFMSWPWHGGIGGCFSLIPSFCHYFVPLKFFFSPLPRFLHICMD